jgi:hypothetical protein
MDPSTDQIFLHQLNAACCPGYLHFGSRARTQRGTILTFLSYDMSFKAGKEANTLTGDVRL